MTTQCNFWIEVRQEGRRYVDHRWQCRRKTNHESEYCHQHRWKHPDYDAFGNRISKELT